MHTQCPRCGAMLADPGQDFPCPRCGARVRSAGGGFVTDEEAMGLLAAVHLSEGPGWKALILVLQQLARLMAFALFFVVLGLCFIALFVGIPLVLAGAPGSDLLAVLYILTPAPVGLFAFGGGALAAYHVFLAAAILSSLAYLVYSERKKLRPLLSDSAGRFRSPDRRNPSGGVQLPQVFLAIFFFDIAFALALAFTGTATRAPPFETYPDWYLYFTFANASVYEEFAARTLLLGLPLLVAYLVAFGWRSRPGLARYAAPAGAGEATAPPGQAATPPVPAPPRPRADTLVDCTVGDLSTALVPRPDDAKMPIAATPAFTAPLESPPPVAPAIPPPPPLPGPATVPQATTSRAESRPAPGPSLAPAPSEAPYPSPGGATVPDLRQMAQKPAPAAPLSPLEYLRSRTANGLWGYFLGGGFKIGPLEAFFIAGSALMFGLAHVAGWDLWKALPTFVAGLGFGYLFLKVGIHAAILLHFAFDYLSLGEALVPGFGLMELVLVVLFTVVGAFYFGHYAVQAAKWFRAQLGPVEHGQ